MYKENNPSILDKLEYKNIDDLKPLKDLMKCVPLVKALMPEIKKQFNETDNPEEKEVILKGLYMMQEAINKI